MALAGNFDPSKHTFEELTLMDDITATLFLEDEQTVKARGGVLILTGTGFKWQVMRWITPSNIILFAKKFEVSWNCNE